ncbi:MAG TPA: ankyrin repeat domain-containing protein [Rhodocyclaceae bacterium]
MRKLTDWLRPFLLIGLLAGAATASAGVYDELMKSAEMGDTDAVMELIGKGMDVNSTDRDGNTLLIIAARAGNGRLLEFLLGHRANTQKKNTFGDSALMFAAYRGDLPMVKQLLTAGADINQPGWNALHYAAYQGRDEVAKLLLAQGADPNRRAQNGQTALMLAAANGHAEVVKALLEAKAERSYKDPQGNSASDLAQKGGNTQIMELLASVAPNGEAATTR